MHERADRLADRVAPHAERGHELGLGGDARAHRPLAAQDACPELLDRSADPVTARWHGDGIHDGCHRLHLLPKFIP
ncbi:hypothetical protein GCM10027186_04870 [Micromonospora schwarzwaldensis]